MNTRLCQDGSRLDDNDFLSMLFEVGVFASGRLCLRSAASGSQDACFGRKETTKYRRPDGSRHSAVHVPFPKDGTMLHRSLQHRQKEVRVHPLEVLGHLRNHTSPGSLWRRQGASFCGAAPGARLRGVASPWGLVHLFFITPRGPSLRVLALSLFAHRAPKSDRRPPSRPIIQKQTPQPRPRHTCGLARQ